MGSFIQSYRHMLLMLSILAYTTVYLYRLQRKSAFDRQFQYLLLHGSFYKCLEHLDSKVGRKIYHDYELALLRFEATLRYDRADETRELIKKLTLMPMKEKDFISFHQRVLEFAVEHKDFAMAETVFEAFSKHKRHAKYAAEAREVIDIYLYHKTNYIDRLVANVNSLKSPSRKATSYYRIARQYYSLGDAESCKKYLEMAYSALPDKTWHKLIGELLRGNYEQFD